MNISQWFMNDNNLDKYSVIEITKLLKTFLAIIPLVAAVLALVNFSLGFINIGITILAVPVFCLASYLALSRGMINLSILILITILIIADTLSCVMGNGVHETGIMVLPVIVLFSSLVLNSKGVIITTSAVIICLAYIVFGEQYGLYPSRNIPPVRWVDLIVVEAVTIIHIFVTYSFSKITKKNLQRVKIELQNQERYKEEIKNSLEEKSELLRLVHHRVKNNLLLINSLIDLESYKDPKSKEGLTEITKSINTIARAHDPLYHTEDYKQVAIGPYLEKLIAAFNQSTTISVNVKIESLLIFHQKALVLGIITQKILSRFEAENAELAINLLSEEGTVKLIINHSSPMQITKYPLEQKLAEKIDGDFIFGEDHITISFPID